MQPTFRPRFLIILLLLLGVFLILSACTQSYNAGALTPIPTAITPIPSLNLTPVNKIEATIFPLIGTHTAVAEGMQQTLVPMNETLSPMIASATAVVMVQPSPAPQSAPDSITFKGIIAWSLVWVLPALLISISGYFASGLQLRSFVLFPSHPQYAIKIFLGEDIDIDQTGQPGFKRLLTLLNRWDEIPDNQQFLVILFMAIVLPSLIILTLPSIGIVNYFPISLLIVITISLSLISIVIMICLRLLGKILGISWFASIRSDSRHLYTEDTLIKLWIKILTVWGIGLPAILLTLAWPGPLLLPRIIVGLIAIIYLFVLWRQAVLGMGAPRLSIFFHLLLFPVEIISRKVKLFLRQTYFLNSTTIWPNLQGGKTKIFISAITVFLWLNLSGGDFWHSVMPPMTKTNQWLFLALGRIHTYYAPIGLENMLRELLLSLDSNFFPFIPTWLPTLLKQAGVLSALAILLIGWLFEFAVWALSSTLTGVSTGLKKFRVSYQPLQAAWHFVSNLIGVLIWRALIWSLVSLSSVKSFLSLADILFVVALFMWILGWLILGVRYILLKLQSEKYYLFPLALIGGVICGPLWGNLKVFLVFLWFVGNLPSLWLTAGRYLPDNLATFLVHVLHVQSLQFGEVLSVEYLIWLLLIYILAALYGAIGIYLKMRIYDDAQRASPFIVFVEMQIKQLGLTFVVWGYFSAALNLFLGVLWNLQTITGLIWLLPLISFIVFVVVYIIELALNPGTRHYGRLSLFISIWFWPLLYLRALRWKMHVSSLNWGNTWGEILMFLKYLYLPLPLRPRKWSFTIPDTILVRGLLRWFSLEIEVPYTIKFYWSKISGAGFTGEQVIVYFLTDSLVSILFWPWLPSAALWLVGSSVVRDGLLVDPGAISFPYLNVLTGQLVLLFSCVFWGSALTLFAKLLQISPPLNPRRTMIALRRNINNLLFASSMVHLLFVPTHIGLTLWSKNTVGVTESYIKFLSSSIIILMALTTITFFGILSRSTLLRQLGLSTHILKDNIIKLIYIFFRPKKFLRLLWKFTLDLSRPARLGNRFSLSTRMQVGLILQIISFVLGWIASLSRESLLPSEVSPPFASLATTWIIHLFGLIMSAFLVAALSIPIIYGPIYQLLRAIYYIFAWPLSFFETSAGQTPAIPRAMLSGLNATLLPQRVIYPGYHHVLKCTLGAIWFSNGLISLILKPVEAIYSRGDITNGFEYWTIIEISFTFLVASYIAAGLTRSIPIVILVIGLPVAVLTINYAYLLQKMIVTATMFSFFLIWINSRETDASISQYISRVILSRFEIIEKKWIIMETFFRLDDYILGNFKFDGKQYQLDFMNYFYACSQSELLGGIKFDVNEEDPLVQSLRIYFQFHREIAIEFADLLLLPQKTELMLETLTPEATQWLNEAVIRVRFLEMSNPEEETSNIQDEYLVTLMQLRSARLLGEVNTIFSDQFPRWRPLPLPIDLLGATAAMENRHTGDLIVPYKILLAIWTYAAQEVDADRLITRWEKLLPSPIAEEVIRAFGILWDVSLASSLTDIAALTFSEHQVFVGSYNYLTDLEVPISSISAVAELIGRAEGLATQDRPQYYVSALQQLQRLQSLVNSDMRDPERVLFNKILRLWNLLLTEALSNTIIPRSKIEINVEQLEREWEQEEVVVLAVINRAQGAAYNLHIRIDSGNGYQVLDPIDGQNIDTLLGQSEVKSEFRLQILVKDDVWLNIFISYDDAGQLNHTLEDKKLFQYASSANEYSRALLPLDFDRVRNPYHYGLPITDPGLFFGRDDIMGKMQRIITSAMHANIIMIYGQRRMGKSTILRQLHQQCRDGQELWPIFIDVEIFTLPGTSGFLWELAHEIWRGLPGGHNVPEPIISKFQASAGTYLIKEWMTKVDAAIAATGRSLLLLLDEFDLVYKNPKYQEDELAEILSIVRGMAHERRKGGIIYVGTYRLLEMTSLYQTPLFNQAVPIKISFLGDDATRQLIRQPAIDLLRYDAGAVSKIMRLTGNHPYYLQLLCSSIFEHVMNLKERRVNISTVIDVLEQAQQQGGLILDYLWKENTPMQKYILATLARLNEHESSRSSLSRIQRELSTFMITVSADDLRRSIESLARWEIVSNENEQYSFTIDLFRLWLREYKALASVRAEIGSLDIGFRTEKL